MTDRETRSGEAASVQKQTDDALRDAVWRLESIIEGTHVGTWEWNVQTGETVYNEVWDRSSALRSTSWPPAVSRRLKRLSTPMT
jgi:hypothetical protein